MSCRVAQRRPRTTLSRALVLFAERPDLWARLVEYPAAIRVAVEELLRWVTPLNNMFRTAVAESDIAGVPVSTGDRVALVYPSANRDEHHFDRPDDVILDRHPNPHLAFGWGTHFCLGANLARATLRITLEELTPRFPRLAAASAPSYEANVFVKAVERFEVDFVPAPA